MLHGSTKVVVRAVALLSAKPKEKVANSLKKCFREINIQGHYMATDSAEEWDSSGPMSTSVHMGTCWLTALAMHMYNKCHVALSPGRFAHPSWIEAMK